MADKFELKDKEIDQVVGGIMGAAASKTAEGVFEAKHGEAAWGAAAGAVSEKQ